MYACFIVAGRPCETDLIENSLGIRFVGPGLLRATEEWEVIVDFLEEKDEQALLTNIKTVKLFITVWRDQIKKTERTADWSCESGLCNENFTCTKGTSPVLMNRSEDPLPVIEPSRSVVIIPLPFLVYFSFILSEYLSSN